MIDAAVRVTQASSEHLMTQRLDQYYTRPDVAERCIEWTLDAIGIPRRPCLWIEPSAGKGAFLKELPRPRVGIDLDPRCPEIARADFLNWRPRMAGTKIVIGNPPFGKNSSLAVKFFNHAASFADFVAFIVPRTFEKESVKRKLDPFMRLVVEKRLGTHCFLLDGAPYDVPTVFQVWRKTSRLRADQHRETRHPDFEFLPSEQVARADFAFQRVGARAGLVSIEGKRKSPQSHYYIAVKNPQIDVFDVLNSIDWTDIKERTAGNPSIGKAELVAAYSQALG